MMIFFCISVGKRGVTCCCAQAESFSLLLQQKGHYLESAGRNTFLRNAHGPTIFSTL
jgi:hypothetical protein